MPSVFVNADFPGAKSEEIGQIYERLEKGNWRQRHDHKGAMNTSWSLAFGADVHEREAVQAAQTSFMACCSPYRPPILVIQWEHAPGERSFESDANSRPLPA